ncbi:MAG TPA: TonB-dependent receptor [Gemmatimonadaceae bacterium]|nr:TonB-dependent receptor [Gemmatimonadaceae bacterium]
MRRRHVLLVLLPLLLLALPALPAARARAQATGRITGMVTAEGGRPISSVNILVVGTTIGAVTNDSGRFVIASVPAGTRQLQARRLGFAASTQTVTIADGATATADFQLQATAVQLAGVVTVGYGTQDRRTLAGAVSSIKSEDLTQVLSANPVDAIKGRLPGVDVTTTSGEPGAAANIRIRGTRSITASSAPLFVVDGVPLTGDLRDFDPSTIESIEVLKDAAAAATYGSRGANGVLLVTTKKGRAGPTQVSYAGSAGGSSILNKVDMMNAQEFANFRREAYRAAGNAACANYLTDPAPCDAVALDATMRANLAAGVDTDWQEALLRTGAMQDHHLAVAGGTENTRFRASAGYLDQKGIAITQAYNAKTATLSLTHTPGRLNLQASAQVGQTLRTAGRGGGIWDEALFNAPLGRVRDDAGNLVFLPTEDGLRVNPVSDALDNKRELERINILGAINASYRLFEGLRAVVNFGPQYSEVSDGWFVGTQTRELRGAGQPFAGLDNTSRRSYTLSNYLELDRTLGQDHRLQGTLLYEIAQTRQVYDSSASRNLPYPHQLWYNLGSGTGYTVRSQFEESALQSYMARANYTLRDRYTFTLLGRVDGSSVLAEGNKYAFFPAGAVAWQIGDEPFMSRVPAITDLKLRVSAGRTGTSAIGPYQTQGTLNQVWYTFGSQIPTALGYQPGAIPNPDLQWETTDKYNLGLDFGLFSQRVSGAIDLYREDTDNLLLSRALPYTTGFASVLQNVGATQNRGFELALSTTNLTGWHGLEWTSDFAFSTNRNKIVRLAGGLTADVGNSRFVGQPISVNYDYKFIGIWQLADSTEAKGMGFKPGDIRVADLNGDGKINGDDRTFIGNHYNFPKWQGSLNNRFRLRGFDLSVLTTARWGYTINSPFISAYTNLIGRFNNRDVNYWTPENPSNEYPRPSTLGIGNYGASLALREGSHVRIRDITLGYELPSSLLRTVGGAGRARLYARAQDPFLFTKFVGWDPESGFSTGNPNSTASQIDVGGPTYRSFFFGIDTNF